MRILVTGTSGFLGSVISFQNSIHEIYRLNRNIGNFACDLEISIPNFDSKFDIVIHNAGKVHCTSNENVDKISFFQVNVGGT